MGLQFDRRWTVYSGSEVEADSAWLEMTATFWFKHLDDNGDAVFAKGRSAGADAGGRGWEMRYNGPTATSEWRFRNNTSGGNDNNGYDSEGYPLVEAPRYWRHISFTMNRNTSQKQMFNNGIQMGGADGMGTLTELTPIAHHILMFGGATSSAGTSTNRGALCLSDLRFYDRVLSQKEIQIIANSRGRDSIRQGLVRDYPLWVGKVQDTTTQISKCMVGSGFDLDTFIGSPLSLPRYGGVTY